MASNMNLPTAERPQSGALVAIEQQRAIAEVQAAMILARQFPRDQTESYARIMEVCKRKTLAEVSQYSYSRGGTAISGPSIRLAEAIAQEWGNIDFGIRELEQRGGVTIMEAYAWDIERNVRERRVFQVRHVRDTKKGSYQIDDQRDIYELGANLGKRRQRACLLAIIPGDIVDAAVQQCNKTLEGDNQTPIQDIAREMLAAFVEFGVSKEMIEQRIQHSLEAVTRLELVSLRKIYVSIKDGFADRSQFFQIETAAEEQQQDEPQTMAEKIKGLGKKVSPQPTKGGDESRLDSAQAEKSGETSGADNTASGAPPFEVDIKDVRALILSEDYDAAADMARWIKDDVLRKEAEKEVMNASKASKK